ncbi:MAG: hypothetical protein R2690_12070 [Acidimicrobiales bacterium]
MSAVVGPDGEWTVELRWVPRDRDESLAARIRRRWTAIANRLTDTIVDGAADALGEGLLIGLLVIGIVLVAVLVVIPLVLIVLDLVVLALIAVGAFILRTCFGRPWIVKARAPNGDSYSWRVTGWERARRRRSRVAAAITSGRFPPPAF